LSLLAGGKIDAGVKWPLSKRFLVESQTHAVFLWSYHIAPNELRGFEISIPKKLLQKRGGSYISTTALQVDQVAQRQSIKIITLKRHQTRSVQETSSRAPGFRLSAAAHTRRFGSVHYSVPDLVGRTRSTADRPAPAGRHVYSMRAQYRSKPRRGDLGVRAQAHVAPLGLGWTGRGHGVYKQAAPPELGAAGRQAHRDGPLARVTDRNRRARVRDNGQTHICAVT
jgi:hypothetical protein